MNENLHLLHYFQRRENVMCENVASGPEENCPKDQARIRHVRKNSLIKRENRTSSRSGTDSSS